MEELKINQGGKSEKYETLLPLHHSQVETETGEDWSIFEYRIRPPTDFIGELVSMGDYAKVLAPQCIVDEGRGKIREMAKYALRRKPMRIDIFAST